MARAPRPDSRTSLYHGRRSGRVSPAVGAWLALVGVLSLAGALGGGSGAGPSGSPATSAAAADPALQGKPALQRTTSRVLGLPAAKPSCKGDDGDSGPEQAPSPGLVLLAASDDPAAEPLYHPMRPVPRLRPLHGTPQSPRAPPRLV